MVDWPLRVITAGGLAVDAFVHHDLAARYDPNTGTGPLSQGDLFQIEAVVAVVAALLVLVTGSRVAWLFALLVAGSALAGILFYRYNDPGQLGPLPDMYEPFWYPEKTASMAAEAVATASAALGLVLRVWWSRADRTTSARQRVA
jgi:hypothetical protein